MQVKDSSLGIFTWMLGHKHIALRAFLHFITLQTKALIYFMTQSKTAPCFQEYLQVLI